MFHPVAKAQNFVRTHKTAIVLGTIATLVIVTQAKGINRMNAFLVQKDLFNEYYFPEVV